MPPLPRGVCPLCGREVALRTRGQLREHTRLGASSRLCAGSGKSLYEAVALRNATQITHAAPAEEGARTRK